MNLHSYYFDLSDLLDIDNISLQALPSVNYGPCTNSGDCTKADNRAQCENTGICP